MSKTIKFTTVINGGQARKPPLKIPYELWDDDSEKWDEYNADGIITKGTPHE